MKKHPNPDVLLLRLQINTSMAQVVCNGVLVPVAWQFVKTGDIVKVRTQQRQQCVALACCA